MADWLLLGAWGLAAVAVLLTAPVYQAGRRKGRRNAEPDPGGPPELTFSDVCRAAGRAKQKRWEDDEMSLDFNDGADAILAELMADGHGQTPEEMQLAYRMGGDEVSFPDE